MYEKHFGLKMKPFGSTAEGAVVFVGPQQAKIMKSLNKCLAAVDSVVVVTGPVGVGKTTIVKRALESISPNRQVAWIGRMALAPDEVLDLLLAGFDVSDEAKGTIRRFAAFRRLLAERAATGAQIAIVVEDAQRIGPDVLVELEALTAADSGDANGANIILMGQPDLNDWLATPDLARLRQRTRLRQSVKPLDGSEVQGYLRHCIRVAEGNFDNIFDDGTVDMLYRCSEGIPRVINNLCESGLTMAAEEGTGPLTAEFVRGLARDALGINVESAPAPEPVPDDPETPAPTQNAPAEAANDEMPDSESTNTEKGPDSMIDSVVIDDEDMPPVSNAEAASTAQLPGINADAPVESGQAQEDAKPKFKMAPLITVDRNTKINVALDPAYKPATSVDQSQSHPKQKPESKAEPGQVPEPEPQATMELEPDPTITPQVLDLDALEAAIDAGHEDDVGGEPAAYLAGDKAPDVSDTTADEIPQITLDQTLEDKRKNVVGHEVAEKLSKAESLDEVDDEMAQTLFGDEDFDAIAAAVVADAPTGSAAADEPAEAAAAMKLELEDMTDTADASKEGTPAERDSEDTTDAADSANQEKLSATTTGERLMGDTGQFNMSLSSRFNILQELKKHEKPPRYSAVVKKKKPKPAPKRKPKPGVRENSAASVEEQLNMATSAARKVVNVTNPPRARKDKKDPAD